MPVVQQLINSCNSPRTHPSINCLCRSGRRCARSTGGRAARSSASRAAMPSWQQPTKRCFSRECFHGGQLGRAVGQPQCC